jgi:hypothetical protein
VELHLHSPICLHGHGGKKGSRRLRHERNDCLLKVNGLFLQVDDIVNSLYRLVRSGRNGRQNIKAIFACVEVPYGGMDINLNTDFFFKFSFAVLSQIKMKNQAWKSI